MALRRENIFEGYLLKIGSLGKMQINVLQSKSFYLSRLIDFIFNRILKKQSIALSFNPLYSHYSFLAGRRKNKRETRIHKSHKYSKIMCELIILTRHSILGAYSLKKENKFNQNHNQTSLRFEIPTYHRLNR